MNTNKHQRPRFRFSGWSFVVFASLVMLTCLACQPEAVDSAPRKPAATTTQSEDGVGSNGQVDATTDAAIPADQSTASSTTTAPRTLDKTYTEKIPPTLVEFDMVLVPGSEDAKIKPFYLGKTEVTWDEFIYWALCKDLREKKAILAREKKLRPSAPHDTDLLFHNFGIENQPVIGLSRKSAELYCQWLSKETGKKYRLPTPEEWEHAFVSGGGDLEQPLPQAELKKQAWFLDNTFDEEVLFDNRAMPVATKAPNKLGIYDMLGNAAEWVSGDEENRVVRGGCFLTPAKKLTGKWFEKEDQNIWNKNYPQTPKSIWWYKDADYVGFRLVCEPG